MTIQLFDLTDASERIFFSPFCWRTRMALKHKGLEFESVPWHFTETDRLPVAGVNRVPIIVDGTTTMGESGAIADYLDTAYPNQPTLLADTAARARARFMEAWCGTIFATLRPIAVPAVFQLITEKEKAYFRESRERMLGARLEDLSKDPVAEAAALNKALGPANDALKEAPFLAGDAPDYSDYVLFGTLMWPYAVCRHNPIDMTSPVGQWFDRLLDRHDGFASAAARAVDNA